LIWVKQTSPITEMVAHCGLGRFTYWLRSGGDSPSWYGEFTDQVIFSTLTEEEIKAQIEEYYYDKVKACIEPTLGEVWEKVFCTKE